MALLKTIPLCVLSAIVFSVLTCQSQTTSQSKCPAVKAKNPQEALMMETGSNKQGCWVRDRKSGLLMFVTTVDPKTNYKPMVQTPTSGKPTCDGTKSDATILGNWLVNLKCVSNCFEQAQGDEEALMTVTITPRLPKFYQVAFGSFPNVDGCANPLQVTQAGPTSYVGSDGTNGNPPPLEGCSTRNVETQSQAQALVVRIRQNDTWQGTACVTSSAPGAWIPTNPGSWMAAPR